jgi:hypothetical protein
MSAGQILAVIGVFSALVMSFYGAWDHNWSAMVGWFVAAAGNARGLAHE